MRIELLRLTAYGRFTGVELDLSAPGLHVVLGANGAGKTTALRAVPDLLYGVPERTVYGFLHTNRKLSLGAVLRDDDGGGLMEVVRRKGRKETLTDPDGVPVSEAKLAALLGGVARDEYEFSFVLTQEEFRAGGKALEDGEGDLGRILFQARGLRGFTEALADLRRRKDELFLRQGQKPRLNKAVASYKQLREEVRENALRPEEYRRLTDELDAARVRVGELGDVLRSLTEERDRWKAVHASLGRLLRRAEANGECQALAAVGPFVPPAAGDQADAIRRQAREAEEEHARIARELVRVREQLAAVAVDEAVLAHAAGIDRLHTRLAAVEDDHAVAEDLTGRQNALRAAADAAVAAACPGRDLAEVAVTLVPAEVRARITGLVGEHDKLAGQEEDSAEEAARRAAEADDAARQIADRLEPPADAGLRAALDAAREAGRPEKDHAAADAECRRLAEGIAAELGALDLSGRATATADALPAPGKALVEAVRRRFEDREAAVERRQADLNTLRERDAANERRLAVLLRDTNPPTERELTRARETRDTAWQMLRTHVAGRNADLAGPGLLSSGARDTGARDTGARGSGAPVRDSGAPGADGPALRACLDAVGTGIAEADAVADRMRLEAASVSERVRLEVERDHDRDRIAALEAELTELDEQGIEIAAAWEDLWRPVGILVGPDPGDAPDVLRRLTKLAADARALREKEAERARLAATVDGHRAGLARELAAAGVKLADAATLVEMVKAADRRLDEIADARQSFVQARARIARSAEERERAAGRAADLAAARQAWRERWTAALVDAGLVDAGLADAVVVDAVVVDAVVADEAAPADAVSLLDGLAAAQRAAAEVLATEREAARRAERIAAFDRAAREIEAACGPVDDAEAGIVAGGASVAGDGYGDDGRVAADRLHARLALAREAEQTRRQLSERLAELTTAQARAEDQRAGAAERLAALLTEHQLTDDQALDAELDRARRHAERTAEIDAIDRDLAGVGIAPEELRRLAEGQDAPALGARIGELDARIAALQADLSHANQELGERRRERNRHDGSAAAADAQGRAAVQLATAVEHAEEYLRLHFAEQLLVAEIERYRAANQNTVLARGAELFARLTAGEYPRLDAPTDEDGRPVLHACDTAGTAKRADQLNEGARDQLYLALRLATLDSYAAAGRRLPFLLDDVLVSFDDARTPVGLEVLADVAEGFQVVVLTHHEAVARAAESLGASRATVHTLPPPKGARADRDGSTPSPTGQLHLQ